MSPDIAIKVESLSKLYRIGLKERMHDTFAGAMLSWIRSPVENYRRLRRLSNFDDLVGLAKGSSSEVPADIIWALKDVSFEVKRGEVLGVIGRNGAGKSTLLKILSQITEPTSGRAEIHGRVASLLEVGTGFHPDLTGRENVYLNGTMLGMTKKEIDSRFDEIVDFSGIEKFLDTPVKRYSSGMYVRLAFSVAAHLEPEILLVDEVLAVGDAEFQQKCLGKMDSITKSGRTILFVSHNMVAIRNLCRSAIMVEHGRLARSGPAVEVVDAYLSDTRSGSTADSFVPVVGSGGTVRLVSAGVIENGIRKFPARIACGEDLQLTLGIAAVSEMRSVVVSIGFFNSDGLCVLTLHSGIVGKDLNINRGMNNVSCLLRRFPLSAGQYSLGVKILHAGESLLHDPCIMHLDVDAGDFYGTGRIPDPRWQAVFQVEQQWQVNSDQ